MTVSDALKALIAKHGHSQAHIARASGIDQGAISRIIAQGREPKADTLTQLERAFPELIELRHRTSAA